MKRLEFNKVIKALGINNVVTVTKGKFGTNEVVHYWENVYINFGGSYYTVVNGRIPLEVVNTIYQKYPKNPYSIRIIKESSDISGLFVDAFQIDTKEGLVVFLSELADYNSKKKGASAYMCDKFDEIMTKVNCEMLDEVKLHACSLGLCCNKSNKEITDDSIFDRELKVALDAFDKTVNPLQDESVSFSDVDDYIKKVSISADVDLDTHQAVKMFITDLSTKNETRFQCDGNGFSYQIRYQIEEGKYYNFLHYLDDSHEVIAIDDKENNIAVKYDLSLRKLVGGSDDNVELTLEQQELLIDNLLLAIGYAASVTVDNMKSNKKMVLKQIKKGTGK